MLNNFVNIANDRLTFIVYDGIFSISRNIFLSLYFAFVLA